MKYFLYIFLLFININIFSFTLKEIKSLALKLQQKGVKYINLIYDWGDGIITKIPIERLGENPTHFYEKEGTYEIKLYISYNYKNKNVKKLINKKYFYYKKENLRYYLKINKPAKIVENKPVNFSANFYLKDKNIKIKNLKFQWFFDDIFYKYAEGKNIIHTFNIPNGDKKTHYNITLKVSFRYKRENANYWLPFKVIKKEKARVEPNTPIEVKAYTKNITKTNTGLSEPFFVELIDYNFFRSESFYKKKVINYRPILFLKDTVLPLKLVGVIPHKPVSPPYNEKDFYNKIIYCIDLDNNIKLKNKNNKKTFIPFILKINDPFKIIKIKDKIIINFEKER